MGILGHFCPPPGILLEFGVLGHFGLKIKQGKLTKDFELYQVFMCQTVLIFPYMHI